MEDDVQHENGRHKQDHCNSLHTQWIIPPQLMKDHHALTMKFMNILAERDAAIQERNLAVSEKMAALEERDMAIMQRDAAMAERNNALMERENAMAVLEYRGNTAVNGSIASTCHPGCGIPRGMKHIHHPSHTSEAHYNSRDMHVSDATPISVAISEVEKVQQAKRSKGATASPLKESTQLRKGKRGSEDMNKQVTIAKLDDCSGQCLNVSVEDLNKHAPMLKIDWKNQKLGLNQVAIDDSTIPAPGCSCTGVLHQCYKWGKGGWQSACCTTTLSMYPLPLVPDKRHARIGGRKMSGSAFVKLLSRLAAEGHDLSIPLDLKVHWAKHGTNRYITIK